MTFFGTAFGMLALWFLIAPKTTGEHIAEIVHAYHRKRAALSAPKPEKPQ